MRKFGFGDDRFGFRTGILLRAAFERPMNCMNIDSDSGCMDHVRSRNMDFPGVACTFTRSSNNTDDLSSPTAGVIYSGQVND